MSGVNGSCEVNPLWTFILAAKLNL